MKANELMLGDWLRTSRGIAKVIAVDKIGLTFKIDGGDFDIDWDDEEEWFDALLLTPEILEKNGFSKSRLMGEQRHFTYYLAPSVSLLAIYDADFSLKIGDCARYIKYVHELQHALRLCGIEKEITI